MNWYNQRPPKSTLEKVPVEHGSPREYRFFSKNYVTFEMSELIRQTLQQLQKHKGGATIQRGTCLTLLQHYGWSSWKLHKEALKYGVGYIQKTAGLMPKKPLYAQESPNEERECGCCTTKLLIMYLRSLECDHWFCVGCWRIYLSGQFETKNRRIECMTFGCNLVIHDELILRICGKTDTLLKKFDDWKFHVYIGDSPYTECPGDDCTYFVKVLQHPTRVRKITCRCRRHVYVNPCCNEWHAPVPCKAWQMWHRHHPGPADVANNNVIYYKFCPGKRCGIPIERNEGCFHMTCSKCHHEFCYLCLEPWKSLVHTSQTKVCTFMTRENTKPVSEETMLFRDGRFKINFDKCQKFKNPIIKANIRDKFINNKKVLKGFKFSEEEETRLTRSYKLLSYCRNSLVALYVFDFFVRFLRDNDKAWFEKELRDFGTSWDRLSNLLQHNLRLVKEEKNVREWFKNMETSGNNVETIQKDFLRGINKLTDNLAYEFRIPL